MIATKNSKNFGSKTTNGWEIIVKNWKKDFKEELEEDMKQENKTKKTPGNKEIIWIWKKSEDK